MPVKKIGRSNGYAVHKRSSAQLFKKRERIETIPLQIQQEIIKNVDFNIFTRLMLVALDKFNPLVIKHPKLANWTLKIAEKLVRLSDVTGKIR